MKQLPQSTTFSLKIRHFSQPRENYPVQILPTYRNHQHYRLTDFADLSTY